MFDPNVNNVLAFLTKLYNDGLIYSALNTARCALASFLQLNNTVNIGSHNLVRRFFKGVFTLRPALPKYNVTWNVDIVLTYLKGQEPLESLSLLQLSRKLLPHEGLGVKSRMCPPYPQRDRKRRLNGVVCRNHRIKRVVPCRC